MSRTRHAWRPSRSVRSRLLLWVLAIAALGLALTGGTVLAIQSAGIDAAADDSLRRGYQEFARLADSGVDPATGDPFTEVGPLVIAAMQYRVPGPHETLFALVDGRPYGYSGGVRPVELEREPTALAAITAVPADGPVTVREVDTSVGAVRLAVVPVTVADRPEAGAFVIAHAIGLERQRLADLGWLFLALGATSLVLLAAVGWQVTGELVRPLSELRQATTRASATDLTRIPVGGQDEIADLTRAYNAMLDRLQDSFTGQRQLLDDVGHELRTPITIARGHLEVLDPTDAARTAETKALVLDELGRMGRLVEDLIVLAKARRPDFVRPAPVEVADLTDEVFSKARALGDRRWLLDEAADAVVELDAQRVTQAWLQLAENAVKFSPPGSTIALGSRVSGDTVRLWVRDEGVGIPVAEQGRIFDRFARVDVGRGVEGSGLGLTIVRAIVDAHHGTVSVASRPGEGSTFSLELPRRAERRAPETGGRE